MRPLSSLSGLFYILHCFGVSSSRRVEALSTRHLSTKDSGRFSYIKCTQSSYYSDIYDKRPIRSEKQRLNSLEDYAMDRKRSLGPKAAGRWGKRLDKESKHNFGNIAENQEIGGCNPDYKFVESFFDENEDGYQWPPTQVTKRKGNLYYNLRDKNNGPYTSYKSLVGEWSIENDTITVIFDRIQSDPFAPPSNVRIRVSQDIARFPLDVLTPKIRNIAICDLVARKLSEELKEHEQGFSITKPTQYVLERKSVVLNKDFIEARLNLQLPGRGRRVDGKYALELFSTILPDFVKKCMHFESYDEKPLYKHVKVLEDQQYLRNMLPELGLVAFVADGSILPRSDGTSDTPMDSNVKLFESPPSLKISVELPNRGKITGMGIKSGFTLIVGGGYHGKTTLLKAIQTGVYNKRPGDGREFVVTSPNAVKIRAEDGRSVTRVDLSTFMKNLPCKKSGSDFTTNNASGSTSQASAIMEYIEMGADLLILDEDISASNFLHRDAIMTNLIKEKEPIVPFLFLVRQFFEKLGISTIMVSGSCGLFVDQAHTILQMDEYSCIDRTQEAKEICKNSGINLSEAVDKSIANNLLFSHKLVNNRVVSRESFKRPNQKIKQLGIDKISYGMEQIDLSPLETLVEIGQTSAITNIIIYLECQVKEYERDRQQYTLRQLLDKLYYKWSSITTVGYNGLDEINGFKHFPTGDCVMPRIFEISAALNRLRSLKITKFVQDEYRPQEKNSYFDNNVN
ncbi:hypothetical protein BEWA_006630 [Theileria equi strain WA]|uniref:Uncharacterized protein n=1 Tax=Theileria equi strain WA TaxID=1537102 RepID=L0B2A2_THEEQ|nr:hypothetical protein BEWA_006630 [Theileria equi strain WA]AFZ81254.1 hypothetical protein BEWA_006630 [Theileria equi strain WA]|eukprot:XP_004830920.1 hypothetical protein BEWA_006630 [Theileria equi strain WA]